MAKLELRETLFLKATTGPRRPESLGAYPQVRLRRNAQRTTGPGAWWRRADFRRTT